MRPSQFLILISFGSLLPNELFISLIITSVFIPITLFVPSNTVIGRSVSSLKVRHLILRYVVSSWRPPESVNTNFAPETKPKNLM